ncbi:hypothetical protein TrVFT333_009366 [Trichoderma virens FT-333]|nr:hypothetical protein TrVFT333_009366 [Trichoderma virens FT-333]
MTNDLNDAYTDMRALGKTYAVTDSHDARLVNSFPTADHRHCYQHVVGVQAPHRQSRIGMGLVTEIPPHVIDSALIFVRAYVGPNATTLDFVYVLNSTNPRVDANSLEPSDCGFDSQIAGTVIPFCALFSEDELRPFEYA